jgi:hypothetical protein
MVALVAAAFVAIAFVAGLWLGASYASALWVERSTVRGGLRKESDGALYYVARCDDPEACCRLQEWLDIEQDRRESADAMRRMQGL